MKAVDEPVKIFLRYFLNSQLSSSQVEDVYNAAAQLGMQLPPQFRHISSKFDNSSHFRAFVRKVQKWQVAKEGWRKAIIRTSKTGTTDTGVFRSCVDVMKSEIEMAGGVSSIVSF